MADTSSVPTAGYRRGRHGLHYRAAARRQRAYRYASEKIAKKGLRLEPPRVTFEGIDLPTWYFWIKRAVEDGIAKVVSGKLPEKIDGKPKLSFNINDPPESPLDRLAAAMDRQNAFNGKGLGAFS